MEPLDNSHLETFIKRNPIPGSQSLVCEYQGLALIRDSLASSELDKLQVPQIIQAEEEQIILQKIPYYSMSPRNYEQLAKDLAKWYQFTRDQAKNHNQIFGLDEDNFIGLNPQINTLNKNWGSFFINSRLLKQIHWINDQDVKLEFLKQFNLIVKTVEEYLNSLTQIPSMVHGDLWNGNLLSDGVNQYLIDPACYWGDPLVDIAMTELFGGFPSVFYQRFFHEYCDEGDQKINPCDYEKVKIIYNLYHQLNHFNLFGFSYLDGCRRSLRQIANWWA